MPVMSLKASSYFPSAARTGTGGRLFRMKNAIIKGEGDESYTECYSGSESLAETITSTALTGTLALTSGSKTVTGTGTAFTTELHLGQFVLFHDNTTPTSYLLVVERIDSDTSFIMSKAATASVSGKTGYRLPVIFRLNDKRGTLLRGNAVQFDKGTILMVGDGTLRVNGTTPSTAVGSFAATRAPKIAVYNSGSNNYSIYTLGMAVPAAFTLAAVAGGTKNMQAGTYSVIATSARTATNGYNNPSAKVKVTLTAGQRVEVTPGAFDTTNGCNALRYYVTRHNEGNTEAENGPWFFYVQSTSTSAHNIEWYDAEVEANELLTFDNDPPPNAEFVGVLAGYPVWISCQGAGNTSPGPFCFPAKPNNIEAAPAKIAVGTSPPETILGVVSALGKLYLPTLNHLQVLQFTGLQDFPFTIRPFWRTGFKNPYQIIFVNGTLWGIPVSGPTRSIAEGDEGSEEHEFAAAVSEITNTWIPGQCLIAHDPKNNAICFFHSADSQNSNGYWTTRVLMWGLRQNAWIGDVILESTTQDMIVSGVATVGENLEFLAGGRLSGGTVSVGTFRFDTGSGANISWYQAWEFTDGGLEDRGKAVKGIHATGIFHSGTVGIHGTRPTGTVDVSALEAGNSGSVTGAISLTNVSNVSITERFKINAKGLRVFTARVDGTWTGSGNKDRVDELVVDYEFIGARK